MDKLRNYNKNIFASIAILLAAFLLFVMHPLFAQTPSVEPPQGGQGQIGQAAALGAANDFEHDVQLGLQNLAISPAAQTQQKEFQGQEYKSTWDEFGVNVLVDGATPPVEVNKQITQDIVQSIEIAQTYNQQEADYLQAAHITPEQVQITEGSVGVDLPPSQPLDPNPSINANPEVNFSPADTSVQDNTGSSTSSSDTGTENANASTSAAENGSSTVEATIPILNIASSTEITSSSAPADMNASTTDTGVSPDENTIYNAILQGEQNNPPAEVAPAPVETVPSPAEIPPIQ